MELKQAQRLDKVEEYYFSKKLNEISLMQKNSDEEIINLGIGSPDLPPSDLVVNKMCDLVKNPQNHQYQSYKGIPELRDAISVWYLNKFKVPINFESEILPLLGSKEGIMHISMSFLNPGDQVLIPNPGYPTYESSTKIAGAEPISYNLISANNWEPDFNEIEKLDLLKVKIMWVNYPHMPTGRNSSKSLLQRLVDFGKKHEILICNDNPYSFILNENPLSIFCIEGAMECCLELNSLSKSHNMSGWRIGMLIGASYYINAVLKFKSNMDSGMFRSSQLAAAEGLNLGDDWYSNLNMTYSKRRVIAHRILDLLNCKYEQDRVGMFIWAKVADQIDDVADWVDSLLHEYKIFLAPGFIFGSNGSRYVRLSLCATCASLTEALVRIQKLNHLENTPKDINYA